MKKMLKRVIPLALLTAMMFSIQVGAAGTMKIDGYFDEWKNIQKTELSYNSWGGEESHVGAMVIQGDYLYCYFEMSVLYHSHIPTNSYYISVNGKQIQMNLQYVDNNGNIRWGAIDNLPPGVHNGVSPIIGNYPLYNAGAASLDLVNTYQGNSVNENDRLEFSIKLSILEEALKMPEGSISNGAKIELWNPNIGAQRMTIVGTSTGAFMGVGLSMLAVVGVAAKKKRKKVV